MEGKRGAGGGGISWKIAQIGSDNGVTKDMFWWDMYNDRVVLARC